MKTPGDTTIDHSFRGGYKFTSKNLFLGKKTAAKKDFLASRCSLKG